MTVAFKHLAHDSTTIDLVTSLISGSKYAHVQIIFSNGEVGGAWRGIGEVALRPINDVITYPFLYDYVEVDEIDEMAVYDYIKQRLGEKFDMVSSISYIVLPINKDKWHCSSIVFSALLEGGLKTKYDYLPAEAISPEKIYNILTKENGYKQLKNDNLPKREFSRQ